MPATAPAPLTLPRKETRDPALDHQALFAAGLDQLRRLAGATWTDHNVHDPGITTLELLSYALTDLGYRATFPMADLLASAEGNAERMAGRFFTARRILTSAPLTTADYRKLLIDLPDVKNAWIHPVEVVYGADVIAGKLLPSFTPGVPGQVPVPVRGLYGVRVEFMENVTTAERRDEVIDSVRSKLAACRNLCEDFVDVQPVQEQRFRLCGELELDAGADVDEVQARVLFAVQAYLSPPVRQHPLDEMVARGYAAEEIFSGPALEHGFIDDAELAAAELRAEIRLSDVIGAVMRVPGVRAVRDLVVQPAPPAAAPDTPWLVPVAAGMKPRLDPARSRLVHYKRNLPLDARADRVEARLAELEAAARGFDAAPAAGDFPIPLGTYRDPGA
ncbi:MAG TPA: hypothetical protein VF541_03715, partial [Longimicrobium sp.]